ncbi:MAG: hypothetical protein GY841_17825, partial [FCB group bacterium]|nr:hypothetical protein [FCB group bacterium]
SMTEDQNKEFIKILGVDEVNPREITDKSNFERDERVDEQELVEERNERRSVTKAKNIRPLRAFGNERDRVIDQSRTGERSKVNAVQPEVKIIHENELNEQNPNNFNEAMKLNDSAKWKEAMDKEIKALEDNGTWEVVDLPPNSRAIFSKWVFTKKMKSNGEIERYKARLVACGNQQVHGIDFQDTFAPVMEVQLLPLFLKLAIMWGTKVHQGDVPNAYVKADCEQGYTIYMKIPKGMNEMNCKQLNELKQRNGRTVLKLKKSLYGLKQAGRMWNNMLDEELKKLGFRRSMVERCLYFRTRNEKLIIVGIYVDDVIAVSPDDNESKWVFNELKSMEIKYLGEVDKFLGIRVTRNENVYTMDQKLMKIDLLRKLKMEKSKPMGTPITDEYNHSNESQNVILGNVNC